MFLSLSLLLVLLSIIGLLLADRFAPSIELSLFRNPRINSLFIRQLIGITIAFALSIFTVIANGDQFLAVGNGSAHPTPIAWLGITSDSTWLQTGSELSITIVSVTLIFLFQILRKNRPLPQFKVEMIFFSILFAFTNSLTEELIFRFSLLNLIQGYASASFAMVLSAISFGIPHYKGMPNGIIGVCMATFLGFVLSKSVLETDGLLIAWFIHFVLDIPIIFTLIWTSKNSST